MNAMTSFFFYEKRTAENRDMPLGHTARADEMTEIFNFAFCLELAPDFIYYAPRWPTERHKTFYELLTLIY